MAHPVSETTIRLHGASFQLRTDLAPETLERIVSFVDEKMNELDPKSSLPLDKISVLTSLSIAGELIEEREQGGGRIDNFRSRLLRLEEILDEALGEG